MTVDKKKDFLLIGKIFSLHGIKGNVKVYSYAESIEAFKPEKAVLVRDKEGLESYYTIKWVKPQNRFFLISFKGIASRNMAEALVGSNLYTEKKCLPVPDDGSYYWFDIIGLSVYKKNKEYIGKVDSIIPTGANDVYVVKNPDMKKENEVLIPGVKDIVLEIDLKKKMMVVDLPEGL